MTAVTINWTGPRLSAEQQAVVQDAALNFETEDPDERLIFEHPLCDGVIECKGRMTHGVYRGRRFLAKLDNHNGKPRTYEFILTDYHEKSSIRASKISYRYTIATGKTEEVDNEITRKTRTSSHRRSRAN